VAVTHAPAIDHPGLGQLGRQAQAGVLERVEHLGAEDLGQRLVVEQVAATGRGGAGGGGGGGNAAGGSGVVIIAYLTADAAGLTIGGGDRIITPGTYTDEDDPNYWTYPASTFDGKTYHVFSSTGSATFTIT